MSQSPREIVTSCLRFEKPERVPRDLWTLPWIHVRYPDAMRGIQRRFPPDIVGPVNVNRPSTVAKGDPYAQGEYTDEWGCVFTNIQAGCIGEVRKPLVANLADWERVRPPVETLPADPAKARDDVNRGCAKTDRFVLAGFGARPWERYQFLRGTENAMLDIISGDERARRLLGLIHDFAMRSLEFWVSTDVDGVTFMDDWGTQSQLLIPPALWRELFKPLYRDYCELAHSRGKAVFMHSDGHIAEIYPDLIEVGVDALNSQLFCMDMAQIGARFSGSITFWGEIDRQHVLTSPDPEEGRRAVRQVAQYLYSPRGGVIAQMELGLGANPAVAVAVFEEWQKISEAGDNWRSVLCR